MRGARRGDAPQASAIAGALTFRQFVFLWNHRQGLRTPALHLEIARWLEARWAAGDRRLLLMVFRDAGKSTLVGLFGAWLLLKEPNLRILVVAAEAALATKMSRNVRRILERHPATAHLVPAQAEQWASGAFTVERPRELRDPSLLARGLGGNLTGSRADVIICDDVEVPNTCDSEGRRLDLRERLRELGFVLVPEGTLLYVGTPHSFYSIYAEEPQEEAGETEPFLAGYHRLVLPVLDAAGASRWPERFTPAKIAELRRASGPARFKSQMLLIPTHVRDVRLDPDRLVRYEADLRLEEGNGGTRLLIGGERMAGVACFWDPALARDRRGDSSVIVALFSDGHGRFWLHAAAYLRCTLPEEEDPLIDQLCRQAVDFMVANEVPAVTVEGNGVGGFVPGRLRAHLQARGLAINVAAKMHATSKERRILDALDPLLEARALHVHARVWETPFVREMREWLPTGGGRDDGLDALAAAVAMTPVRPARGSGPLRRPAWQGGGTFTARTDFPLRD